MTNGGSATAHSIEASLTAISNAVWSSSFSASTSSSFFSSSSCSSSYSSFHPVSLEVAPTSRRSSLPEKIIDVFLPTTFTAKNGDARGDALSTRCSLYAGRCPLYPILFVRGEIPSLPDPLRAIREQVPTPTPTTMFLW